MTDRNTRDDLQTETTLESLLIHERTVTKPLLEAILTELRIANLHHTLASPAQDELTVDDLNQIEEF